ncbi:unnamed protein product, partial [Meganyctiphanes norvegica]
MRILLILGMMGWSAALQPGFEYTYRYRGRVALGIPSISSQVSVFAFYCDAKVQVLESKELNIQFSNFFKGDMNERVTCEDSMTQSDGYSQMEFEPISGIKDILEKPFGLRWTGLYVPDSDSMWIRNLRRAFVHMLHIPRAKTPDFGETLMANYPSFSKMEVHPLGECPSRYTVTPLKEHLLKYYLPPPLENDAQADDLQNDYWRLSKSVDFDNCTDTVSSHTFGTMLPGKSDNDKCGEDYVSTATTGFYVMKGGPGGVRLEKAVQEGTYIIDHDDVQTYTNQTLDLRSVDPAGAPFDVSGSFYGFRQEIDANILQSDMSTESNINKDKSIQDIKVFAIAKFKEAADALSNGQPFNFAEDMEALSESAGLLDKDALQEIYDNLFGDARSLFMKALTASGLETPYLFLMEKLKNALDPVNHANQIDFFLNAVQNTKTTKLIEPMMNFVMNYNGPDFIRGLAIVNFATLATRMCTKPCGRQYLGETGCQVDSCKRLVEDTYLPWLAQGLDDELKIPWERMVFMMAIYNFNSEKILPIIRPYVSGARNADIQLRVSAIYALRKDDMPSSTRNEILQCLMTVFDNYQEHYRIREAAFGVMLHWDPEPSWWHYMALNTWRDPNNNLVSLVSNTIYTFKEYRPAAKRVAALTKPVKPISISKSFLAYNKDGNNDDIMRYWYEFFISGNDKGIFPHMVSAYLRLGLADTNFDAFKIMGHFDDSEWQQLFQKAFANLFGKKDWSPSDYLDKVKGYYQDILAKLEMETKEPAKNIDEFLHMTLFNNLQVPIPKLHANENIDWRMYMYLFGNINVNRQFFINSGRISHAYATEVGLPYMTKYTQPMFFSLVSKSTVTEQESKSIVDIQMTFRVDRLIQSSSHVLIPGMGRAMVSGVNKRQMLVLPYNIQITYDEDTTELTIEVAPNDLSVTEQFGMYNTPFTLRAPIVTPERLSALEDFEIIRSGPEVF